jgi:hypothetical protein
MLFISWTLCQSYLNLFVCTGAWCAWIFFKGGASYTFLGTSVLWLTFTAGLTTLIQHLLFHCWFYWSVDLNTTILRMDTNKAAFSSTSSPNHTLYNIHYKVVLISSNSARVSFVETSLELCEISSSHGGEYEAQNLLECTAVFLI